MKQKLFFSIILFHVTFRTSDQSITNHKQTINVTFTHMYSTESSINMTCLEICGMCLARGHLVAPFCSFHV